jgi:hypothetical protein
MSVTSRFRLACAAAAAGAAVLGLAGAAPVGASPAGRGSSLGARGLAAASATAGPAWPRDVLGSAGPTGDVISVTDPGAQSDEAPQVVSLQLAATDSAAGQALTYAAVGLPAGPPVPRSSFPGWSRI